LEAKAYDGSFFTARDSSPDQSLSTKKVREEEVVVEKPATKKLRKDEATSFQAKAHETVKRQDNGKKMGLPGRNLLEPSYKINNALGPLSNRTIYTDLVHEGGYTQYDTHNL